MTHNVWSTEFIQTQMAPRCINEVWYTIENHFWCYLFNLYSKHSFQTLFFWHFHTVFSRVWLFFKNNFLSVPFHFLSFKTSASFLYYISQDYIAFFACYLIYHYKRTITEVIWLCFLETYVIDLHTPRLSFFPRKTLLFLVCLNPTHTVQWRH